MTLTIRSAALADEQAAVGLWRACDLVVSYNDPAADFRFAKAGSCSDVLVAEDDAGRIVGSVMVEHDGHRGWLYYIITSLPILARGEAGAAEGWCGRRRSGSGGGAWSRPSSW